MTVEYREIRRYFWKIPVGHVTWRQRGSVFQCLNYGQCHQMYAFFLCKRWTFSMIVVWTVGENKSINRACFQTKTPWCGSLTSRQWSETSEITVTGELSNRTHILSFWAQFCVCLMHYSITSSILLLCRSCNYILNIRYVGFSFPSVSCLVYEISHHVI